MPRARNGAARVLLVEDNASVRRAMSRLLALEGYRVTPVASRSEALQHVHEGVGVDLLICDYHLSGGETGTQVVAALRAILGDSLPALLTSGDTSSAIKQLPRDPHLRFTSKPIKAEELVGLLRALCSPPKASATKNSACDIEIVVDYQRREQQHQIIDGKPEGAHG